MSSAEGPAGSGQVRSPQGDRAGLSQDRQGRQGGRHGSHDRTRPLLVQVREHINGDTDYVDLCWPKI